MFSRLLMARAACVSGASLLMLNFALPALSFTGLGTTESTQQSTGQSGATPQHSCVLTETKGTVQKRDHNDWTAPTAEQFIPASKGDKLKEGMQVATGEQSYAQLTWPDVTARAWANSIYSLAPNHRIVYLQSGQMLFNLDKHRKDKREYVLWTNLLQARVRGTTVFVQTDEQGKHSQITVLEGYIDVLNRKDKSMVRIYPGAIYDIRSNDAAAGSTQDKSDDGFLPVTSGAPVPLFATNQTTVSVFAPNTNVLYNQPLVKGFETPLPSLPLVTSQLQSLPAALTNTAGGVVGSTVTTVTSALSKVAQILRVPTGVDYLIGQQVGPVFKVPSDAVSYFPPIGYVAQSATGGVDLAKVSSPITNLNSEGFTAIGAATSASSTATAASIANRAAQINTITQMVNTGALGRTASNITSTVGTLTGSTGTFSGITGTLTGTVGGTIGGVGGTLSGTTGTLGGTLGGLGGALGGLGGGLGGLGGF